MSSILRALLGIPAPPYLFLLVHMITEFIFKSGIEEIRTGKNENEHIHCLFLQSVLHTATRVIQLKSKDSPELLLRSCSDSLFF